jgi:hypothetical protein
MFEQFFTHEALLFWQIILAFIATKFIKRSFKGVKENIKKAENVYNA